MISKKILGVRVDFGMSYDDVTNKIEKDFLTDKSLHYICTTNPEFIMDAQKDNDFMDIINNSDISTPDGYGVVLAEKFQEKVSQIKEKKENVSNIEIFFNGISMGIKEVFKKNKIDERICGVELTYKICEMCDKRGYSIFLLGGWPKDKWGKKLNPKEDFATTTSLKLKSLYPNLKVVGASSQFSWKEEDDTKTVAFIKKKMVESNVDSIDFLFVAYNHIKQEKWIIRNAKKIPVKVSMGVGGTFDYISGHYIQTPNFFETNHLSWLFRLITQPHRFKRVWKAFPTFPLEVYRSVTQ